MAVQGDPSWRVLSGDRFRRDSLISGGPRANLNTGCGEGGRLKGHPVLLSLATGAPACTRVCTHRPLQLILWRKPKACTSDCVTPPPQDLPTLSSPLVAFTSFQSCPHLPVQPPLSLGLQPLSAAPGSGWLLAPLWSLARVVPSTRPAPHRPHPSPRVTTAPDSVKCHFTHG